MEASGRIYGMTRIRFCMRKGKCHLAFIVRCYVNTRRWDGRTLLTLLSPCPLPPEGLLLVKGKKKLHDFTPAGQDFFLALLSSISKCYLFLRAYTNTPTFANVRYHDVLVPGGLRTHTNISHLLPASLKSFFLFLYF